MAWVFAFVLVSAAVPAHAQVPPAEGDTVSRARFAPPVAGTWEPVRSLGQPSPWRPFMGFGYGWDRSMPGEGAGASASVGVVRDLYSPLYGLLAVGGEMYAGQRGEELDGGARLYLESAAVLLNVGVDRNLRARRTDLFVGTSFPPVRGGLFSRGGHVRVHYLPGRDRSVEVGVTLPARQPRLGRTRPRVVDVPLPRVSRQAAPPAPLPHRLGAPIDEVREAMEWLVAMSSFFWLTENQALTHEATVREWRATLTSFRDEILEREPTPGPASSHEGKVEAYHTALDRAFGIALGAEGDDAIEAGRPLADRARRKVLEEVILPYNRTIGQYRGPDSLEGLLARARARWTARLRLDPPANGDADAALAVLDAWLLALEALRTELANLSGDSRMNWLPLALALRPEEHRTGSQIDALVELALGSSFTSGNALLDTNAPQFQVELLRTLAETRTYHVLWIHDIRGEDEWGDPDRTAFHLVAEGYLRTLIDAVSSYDETGRMPAFFVVLDQHYYELNNGRRWMDLLESPLTHRVRLPRRYAAWSEHIAELQASLRSAIRDSERLQAETAAFGPAWVEDLVKVHVNITNPSDLSFRNRRLLGPPLGADNLMRDHRKLVLRDIFEDDPASGELILSGVGVGDHYATATWDDRSLLVQGPGAAEVLPFLRRTLARNGLGGTSLPAPLRPRQRAPDHAARVAGLEEAGADARILQVHNRTGWGDKDATFVQMLLYDLAPPGTVLYVPDSLWTSFQWMAQLVSAALRGCHVYIVGPALENAPSAGFPQMSVMQELLARLVIIEEVFGDRIREGGGDLRIGLFSRTVPLDAVSELAVELEEGFAAHAFLRELFPFSQGVVEAVRASAAPPPDSLIAPGFPGTPAPSGLFGLRDTPGAAPEDTRARVPQLHRKTQWIVDREVLQAISADPGIEGVVRRSLEELREGIVRAPESGPLMTQQRMEPTLELLDLWKGIEGRFSDPVLYFATGSLNKNVRSLALDGEAIAVVSGAWAIQSFLDLVLLTGGVTWVDSLEELDRLLPSYSPLRRRIGRWLHRVL
jgi:hypothetical protein